MKHTVLRRTSRSLLSLALAMYLLFALTACSKMENVSPNGEPTRRTTQSAENAGLTYDLGGSNVQGVLSSGEDIEYYVPAPVKNPGDRTVTLFIWNVDSWKTVQWHYRDTLTAKKLLAGLAYVTNWDLTCEVKPATQKLTFRWDKASSLFSGIPLPAPAEQGVLDREPEGTRRLHPRQRVQDDAREPRSELFRVLRGRGRQRPRADRRRRHYPGERSVFKLLELLTAPVTFDQND